MNNKKIFLSIILFASLGSYNSSKDLDNSSLGNTSVKRVDGVDYEHALLNKLLTRASEEFIQVQLTLNTFEQEFKKMTGSNKPLCNRIQRWIKGKAASMKSKMDSFEQKYQDCLCMVGGLPQTPTVISRSNHNWGPVQKKYRDLARYYEDLTKKMNSLNSQASAHLD